MPTTNALEQLVGTMTIAELADKSGRAVDQIVAFALGGGTKTSTKRSNGAAATTTSSRQVDTRSHAGRQAYQNAVLEAIKGASDYVGAIDIRNKVGGTPMQCRAAVNRLIEDGEITFKGRARSTRYTAA
jgi:hypothetical protein